MEDKRVTKTKHNIRSTLISLLQEKPFEKITVAEICRVGMISRITFYTHYDSKYSLLNEMISDYMNEADINYHRMQKLNNPNNDGHIGYENLLECILCLFYDNQDFFSHIGANENPYLFSEFFNYVFRCVNDYIRRHTSLVPKYPIRQTAALISNGLFGVVNACADEDMPDSKVRELARSMYRDLLQSDLFSDNQES